MFNAHKWPKYIFRQSQAKTLVAHFITRCLCHKMPNYTHRICAYNTCIFDKVFTFGQKTYKLQVKPTRFQEWYVIIQFQRIFRNYLVIKKNHVSHDPSKVQRDMMNRVNCHFWLKLETNSSVYRVYLKLYPSDPYV